MPCACMCGKLPPDYMTLCRRNCNQLYCYVRNPCVPGGLQNSNTHTNTHNYSMLLSVQSEKHHSTLQSLSRRTVDTAAKTQTHYCYYTPASLAQPPPKHTRSLSLSLSPPLLFCTFSTPLAVSAVREGREERGRGRDRRGGEGGQTTLLSWQG